MGDLTRNEGKTTEKASITVERAWLSKIRVEAADTGLQPAFTLGFDPPRGRPRDEDWKAYPLEIAEKLEAVAAFVLSGNLDRAREVAEHIPARGGAV